MPFDWTAIVTRNRADLARLVVVLFRLAGVTADHAPERLSRGVWLSVLRMLRPAEAALRRLIVIAARGLVVALPVKRAMPVGGIARGSGGQFGSFALLDPRRLVGMDRGGRGLKGPGPQIRSFDEAVTRSPDSEAEGVVAGPLLRRLARLERALSRLPAEARRLARWRLRHPTDLRRPMRPGRPPGLRSRGNDDLAQEILRELQTLSLWAMNPETV